MKTTLPDICLLDVGGTFIKCSDGRQVPVPSAGSREEISAAFREAVGDVSCLKGIGVSIPGPFDYGAGIFLMKHKYAAVYGESFRELAGVPAEVPLKYMHDVNAPLLGAVKLLGAEDRNVALVTLGTGLGFSYSLKGEVQTNEKGSPARNLWNLPFEGGILEDRISARGICKAYYNLSSLSMTAEETAKRAYGEDHNAIQVFAETGALLGQALKPIVDELQLQTMLMGGQVSRSLSLMLEPLKKELPGISVSPLPDNAVFAGLESLFISQ